MITSTQLSKNFTLLEFTRSGVASQRNIMNVPTELHVRNMQLLCDNVLERIRERFNKPVNILSGFRSRELNAAVGGAPDSQHTMGQAADIEVYGIRNDDLFCFIADHLNFDQVIAEQLESEDGSAGWIHVSYRQGSNRKQELSFLGKERGYVNGLVYARQ